MSRLRKNNLVILLLVKMLEEMHGKQMRVQVPGQLRLKLQEVEVVGMLLWQLMAAMLGEILLSLKQKKLEHGIQSAQKSLKHSQMTGMLSNLNK